MLTYGALKYKEVKPLMCHFWQTIYDMRPVNSESFAWGCSEISRNILFYPATVLRATLQDAIETKRCSGQINNCMSTNLWVSFQPSSGKTSNVHLFNRHQPLIFTVSFHSLLIIKQAKPAVLRNYQCHYFGSHFSWSISHGRRYVNKLTWPSTANLVWPWKIVDPAESIRILIGHSRIAIMAALGDASWQTDMRGGRD